MPAEIRSGVRSVVRAIAFDVNGTLVDILTDDHQDQNFRAISHFLTYLGIDIRRQHLAGRYFEILKAQQHSSTEAHPEFDAAAIWRQLIEENASDFTRALPVDTLRQLPLTLAQMYRGISRRRLRLYPGVRHVLDLLHGTMPLGIVTDAQSPWARAELHKVGILGYFSPIVVSGDHGFRKPDPRLFRMATHAMGVPPAQTLYVGNDMHRDIYGAREAGMQTAMFDSPQGAKDYRDCVPDFRITDFRDLVGIVAPF